MGRSRCVRAVVSAVTLFSAGSALAEPWNVGSAPGVSAEHEASPVGQPTGSAAAAADAGLLLPSTLPASVNSASAFAVARSGYSGLSDGFSARAAAEGNLTHFLALRVDYEHGSSLGSQNDLRIGARLQLLKAAEDGLDGSLGLFYDPNDFRREGSMVIGALAGKRFGRLGLTANLLFGSDPEGDDQVLELRAASLYRVTSQLELGLDGRGRFDLSSDAKRAGTDTRDFELHVLPTASLALGSFAIVLDAGLSAERTTEAFGTPSQTSETHTGVLTMLGAAAAF